MSNKRLVGYGLTGEEIELYKERLKEMEMAFQYNLNLLAERDAELDIIEEQLRNRIVELERVSQEKAECEEVLKRLHEEKVKETRLLKKKVIEQENAIKVLERKNCGNVRSLKKALEYVKQEKHEEIERAENNFIRMIQLKENEHLEELRKLEMKHAKKLDEAARERQRFYTENRNLRKQLAEAKEKERLQTTEMEHLQRIYDGLSKEITGTDSRGTMTKWALAHAGTQTANKDYLELRMLREQNDVLKRIIKNLKRKIKFGGRRERGEWEYVNEKIEETNRRFESEIMQVKKEVERERTEEETIMQSLEKSFSSLKQKLLKNVTGEDDQVKLELQINQRLERIDEKLEELRKRVDTGARTNIGNSFQ